MKLKEQMRLKIRAQGKSRQTFKTYWYWCEKFLRYVKKLNGEWRHPSQLGKTDVEDWLSYLANHERVSNQTQNLALQSVCYLYRHLLNSPLESVSAIRSKLPQRERDVLDVSEVHALLAELQGVPLLVSQLIYGCGLRIGDALSLRIKDISFGRCQLHIYDGKGLKDRYTAFPEVLHESVKNQIEYTKRLHARDAKANPNGVSLPNAWRKKSPRSANELRWHYLFCSENLSRDDYGILCRHHRHASHIAREIKEAANRAGIHKRVTSHVLRHCYATHCNEQGVDIRTLQVLLGHSDIRTTEIYVHCNQHRATSAKSPLESLLRNPPVRKPEVRLYG